MSGRSTRIGVPGETVAPGTRRGSGGPPLSSAMRPPPGARAPKRTRAWTAEHTLLGQFNRNRSLSWANYPRCRIAREAAADDAITGGPFLATPGVPPPSAGWAWPGKVLHDGTYHRDLRIETTRR